MSERILAMPFGETPPGIPSSQHLAEPDPGKDAPFSKFIDTPRHIGERRRDLLHEVLLRVRFQAAFLAVALICVEQFRRACGIRAVHFAVFLHERKHGIRLLAVLLQLIGVDLRLGEHVVIVHEPAEPLQCEKENAVRFHAELLQQFGIALVLRHGVIEPYDNEPAVEALRAIPVILR